MYSDRLTNFDDGEFKELKNTEGGIYDNDCYCELDDCYYDENDVIWSEYHRSYIPIDESVETLSGDIIWPEYAENFQRCEYWLSTAESNISKTANRRHSHLQTCGIH